MTHAQLIADLRAIPQVRRDPTPPEGLIALVHQAAEVIEALEQELAKARRTAKATSVVATAVEGGAAVVALSPGGSATASAPLERGTLERFRLEQLALQGRRVVCDFMPNVGQCALQDYAQLNEFLRDSEALERQVAERLAGRPVPPFVKPRQLTAAAKR